MEEKTMTDPNLSANGLMAFWARIDADYLMTFQQWHNCEHVPERVAIPGFLRGRRYRDLSGDAFFLMFYETRDTATLGSSAYMAALNSPTRWTKEALSHFKEPARNIYSLVREWGGSGVNAAPYLVTMRFNLSADENESKQSALQNNWLNAVSAISGIRRVRFYEVDEAITRIATSERKIYGDGPGAQQYLVFIEGDVPVSEWLDQVEGCLLTSTQTADPRKNLRSDLFWLEFGYLKQNEEAGK